MDYFKELKESVSFVWQHKFTFIYGFIITIASASSDWSFNLPDTSSSSTEDFNPSLITNLDNIIVIVLVVGLIGLLIGLLLWILRLIAHAALIKSVKINLSGDTPTLATTWSYGLKNIFRFILLSLLVGLIVFILFIPIIIAFVLFIINLVNNPSQPSPVFFVLFCIGGLYTLFVIFVAFLLNILSSNASRLMVLNDNLGAVKALKDSWYFLKINFDKLFVASLYGIIPLIANALVAGFVFLFSIPLFILAFVAIIALVETNPVLAIIISILIGLVILLGISILLSPVRTVVHVYWSRVIIQLAQN